MAKTLDSNIYTIDPKNVCIPGDIVKDATKQLTIFEKSYNKNVPGKVSGFLRTNTSIVKKLEALCSDIQNPIKILTFYNCYFRDCKNSGDVSAPLKKISKKLRSVANFIGASGSESIATKGVIGIVKGKRNKNDDLESYYGIFDKLNTEIDNFFAGEKNSIPNYSIGKWPQDFEFEVLSVPKVNTVGAVTTLATYVGNFLLNSFDTICNALSGTGAQGLDNDIEELKKKMDAIDIESLYQKQEYSNSNLPEKIPSYAVEISNILKNLGESYMSFHSVHDSFKSAYDLSTKNNKGNFEREKKLVISEYTKNKTTFKEYKNNLAISTEALDSLLKFLKGSGLEEASKAYEKFADFQEEELKLLDNIREADRSIRNCNLVRKDDGTIMDYGMVLNQLSEYKTNIIKNLTNISNCISSSEFSYSDKLLHSVETAVNDLNSMREGVICCLENFKPAKISTKQYNDYLTKCNKCHFDYKVLLRKKDSIEETIIHAIKKMKKKNSILNLNKWLLNAQRAGLLAGLTVSLYNCVVGAAVKAATGGSK